MSHRRTSYTRSDGTRVRGTIVRTRAEVQDARFSEISRIMAEVAEDRRKDEERRKKAH